MNSHHQMTTAAPQKKKKKTTTGFLSHRKTHHHVPHQAELIDILHFSVINKLSYYSGFDHPAGQ